ncbi:MAG: 50S ribosomal protein L15 [Oscillospiraceae bacterium]|nr:50S ribosomal protein L15 [Oscillospiraceae bacterium]
MNLHELSPAPGSRLSGWRIGRGIGSGNGKTSGRGHKGQKSRSGYSRKRGFEGGQMPLHRRLPKRGFNNARFAKPDWTTVNLSDFDSFDKGSTVGLKELQAKGLAGKAGRGLKVLGNGTIENALTIVADCFSESARLKIEQAGGKAEVN